VRAEAAEQTAQALVENGATRARNRRGNVGGVDFACEDRLRDERRVACRLALRRELIQVPREDEDARGRGAEAERRHRREAQDDAGSPLRVARPGRLPPQREGESQHQCEPWSPPLWSRPCSPLPPLSPPPSFLPPLPLPSPESPGVAGGGGVGDGAGVGAG